VLSQFDAILAELLLEERIEDDGSGAVVFHLFDTIDFLRERGSGGDQRGAKLQAEVVG
jgi:hypothetical protein